jgi:CheY-like chemotaxis protein
MNVLIVERRRRLAELWRRALERLGVHLDIASSQDQAAETYHIVVLDLLLDEGSAFAVADIVSYRQSDDQVIFVINTSFFCDGSIFRFFSDDGANVQSETVPDDLAAIIEHYVANRHNDSRP